MTDPLRFDPQPIAKVETAWHAPWMLIGSSQQGTSHFHNGVANADSYKLGSLGSRAWLIAADGVGSEPLAYRGSRVATAVVERQLAATVHEPMTAAVIEKAFAAAHDAISAAAQADGHHPDKYPTTLCAIALEGQRIVGGSIGDSSIAIYSLHGHDGQQPLLTPFCSSAQSEIPNQTHVITDPRWRQHATFNETEGLHIKAILLGSDGAENFFLKQGPDDRQPTWNPHILEIFDEGIAALSVRNFFAFFSNFLQRHEPSHDDDRTLLIAYRIPQEHTPPAPQPRKL